MLASSRQGSPGFESQQLDFFFPCRAETFICSSKQLRLSEGKLVGVLHFKPGLTGIVGGYRSEKRTVKVVPGVQIQHQPAPRGWRHQVCEADLRCSTPASPPVSRRSNFFLLLGFKRTTNIRGSNLLRTIWTRLQVLWIRRGPEQQRSSTCWTNSSTQLPMHDVFRYMMGVWKRGALILFLQPENRVDPPQSDTLFPQRH